MVRLVLLLLCAALPVIASPQDTFPALDVRITGSPYGGYLVAAPISRDSFGFIDKSGRVVFRRGLGLHTNVRPNGTRRVSAFTGNFGFFNYVIMDSTLTPVDTVYVTPPYSTDSHEGAMWSDTTFMMLGLDFRPFDMSQVVQGGQPNASLMATVVQERHLKTDSVLFEWNAFGRIPVTDATPNIELRQRTIDYIHANSIARDTDGDLIISCRHLDEIIKIRRSDGSIVWRLGGVGSKNKQFAFVNDDHDGVQGFSHQHMATRTSRGTILLFDNGNLKPLQRSRVVEYALDTIAMTATRVWSYTPEPAIYCPSQGSVQELPNGNLLIGLSSTNDSRIAEEVDRSGRVHMQVRNMSDNVLQPYRVFATTLGCTSIEQQITSPGRYTFSSSDSTTGIVLNVTRVGDTASCRVERHYYRPHDWQVDDTTVCGPLSTRWTIRSTDSTSLQGALHFDGRDVSSPSSIILYHRSREGFGRFTPIPSRYDVTSGDIIVDTIADGEYAAAYARCVESIPVLPRRGATNVAPGPVLRWSEAPDAVGYDLQVSLQPDVTLPFVDITTARRDTTILALPPSTDVYWRVRKRTTLAPGAWSDVWTFTTAGPVGVEALYDHPDTGVRVRRVTSGIEVSSTSKKPRAIAVYDAVGRNITTVSVDSDAMQHVVPVHELARVCVVVVTAVDGSVCSTLVLRD